MKSNNNTSKPFCKVCFDSGKSEALYTNHYVKSEPGPKGKVICPTLLSMKCSYCKDSGHTVKYCIKAAKNKKENSESSNNNKDVFIKTKLVSNSNRFNTLDNDDELEDGEEKDDFPALCELSNQDKVVPKISSFALVASKPPVNVKLSTTDTIDVKHDFKTHRWADDELTDDDDDELRMKYKRVFKPHTNNFVITDDDNYDNLSILSYNDYDDYYDDLYTYNNDVDVEDDGEDYSNYLPSDILNSVTCVNWRNCYR